MTYRNSALVVCLNVVLCGLSQVAAGATLCVQKNPSPGCPYPSIGAAVAAASVGDVVQVSQGTYKEDVVVGKAISLVGKNRNNTIIDATGLKNGIYVDGLDNAGLVGVSVSGFKVQNANFEGILITNASGVTISDNYVLKNNVNLNVNAGECTDVPPFETNEGFDCGEGIHLSGVDHSIVANNLVEKNSGGILLSDDTGATHDNLIMGNTVQNNPFDCGITLASHTLFGTQGPPTAAGVFHNTINGNVSDHNGRQTPGAGAGVGLFAPAPWNKTYGNVVVNNIITDNGLPGVSMHAHSPGASLPDNMIAANYISGNLADTDDTATSGPTGINVSGGDDGAGHPLAVITGTVIAGNTILQETIGIATKTNSLVEAHLNDFINPSIGVDNINGGSVDATLNWWGCSKGPNAAGCADISGANVLYLPFLTSPF
ncbi:MAG TPA: NosD domain-containing protein [Candidatus Sulfotelmatobacter sp.]